MWWFAALAVAAALGLGVVGMVVVSESGDSRAEALREIGTPYLAAGIPLRR